MKQVRKIIFIILAILPILPLICQVISNIGKDTESNSIFSWGEYGNNNERYQATIDWELYTREYNGKEIEYIYFDVATSNSTGIADRLLWGLYQGQEIRTETFMGTIFKTTYKLTSILGIPNSVTWIYVILYIVYMIFIEIIMFIVDLTMLVPRKIKEWLN